MKELRNKLFTTCNKKNMMARSNLFRLMHNCASFFAKSKHFVRFKKELFFSNLKILESEQFSGDIDIRRLYVKDLKPKCGTLIPRELATRSTLSRICLCHPRHLSGAPAKPSHLNVFDRQAKLLQRQRAANLEETRVYDYLRDEIGYVLADRVIDIKRDLDLVLDLGCSRGHVLKHLHSSVVNGVIATDRCAKLLEEAEVPEDIPCQKLVMDEENITFKDNTFNLVVSALSLHWVNDLPKTFRKINRILKPDGAFLVAMFGSQTLFELRCSLQLSELEREGGIGSHISPFAQVQDIGSLLNLNGFTMLTLDTEEQVISYPSIFELMEDLKGMGENNASWKRKVHLSRDTMFAAGATYQEMYGNKDGTIPATFQVIYFIAWKPDPSQPKPLPQQKPDVSLKDLDKLR